MEKCADCAGRGNIICSTCNVNQESGSYKENQMSQCPTCYGRGLIAHRDGSDTMWDDYLNSKLVCIFFLMDWMSWPPKLGYHLPFIVC